MGALCKSSGGEYVNKDKVNGFFYCNLSDIGFIEKVNGTNRWKEVKYELKNCRDKKRADEPKARN